MNSPVDQSIAWWVILGQGKVRVWTRSSDFLWPILIPPFLPVFPVSLRPSFVPSFLVPRRRCTIYTAVYKDQPVVVKLMRKDVQDASLVRDELELELALLRRLVSGSPLVTCVHSCIVVRWCGTPETLTSLLNAVVPVRCSARLHLPFLGQCCRADLLFFVQ